MSVLDVPPIKSHVYTGVGVYEFDFKTYLSTDLVCSVLLPDGSTSPLVKDTDYSVSIATAPTIGGSITILVDSNPTATNLYISRELPYTQEVDWENGGPLDQPLLTRGMDRIVMLLQQMKAFLGSNVALSSWKGDWITGTAYAVRDMVKGPTGDWYVCTNAHISSVFATDLVAGRWLLAISVSEIGSVNVPDPSAGTDEQVIKVSSGAYVLGAVGSDAAYGSSWNGVTTIPPSKNTVYDYLENYISKRNTLVSGLNTEGGIMGGDVTVSGNTLTISKCSCMSSDLTTAMATTSDSTVVLPATVNQDFYTFIVRLVADGSFTMKAYTTYVGPASDALVDKWKWLDYSKNNGSGVTMPYRNVGGRIDWMTLTNCPVITSTLNTTLTSYSLTAIIPVGLLAQIGIVCETTTGNIRISHDGTNFIRVVQTYTVAQADIVSVSSIYLAYYTASSPVKIGSITLRR